MPSHTPEERRRKALEKSRTARTAAAPVRQRAVAATAAAPIAGRAFPGAAPLFNQVTPPKARKITPAQATQPAARLRRKRRTR